MIEAPFHSSEMLDLYSTLVVLQTVTEKSGENTGRRRKSDAYPGASTSRKFRVTNPKFVVVSGRLWICLRRERYQSFVRRWSDKRRLRATSVKVGFAEPAVG